MKQKIQIEDGLDITVIDKRDKDIIAKGDVVKISWNDDANGWDILLDAGIDIFIESFEQKHKTK